jgi:hypothetical protein
MASHPHEFTDTDPAVMEVWLDLLRRKPAGEKLGVVLSASDLLLKFFEMGVRNMYPNADNQEVRRRVAARHLPRELVIAAYGWDPDADDAGH